MKKVRNEMRVIKITRNDIDGSYYEKLKNVIGAIQGELDDIEFVPVGTSITLTIEEMSEEVYAALPEFTGW